MRISSRYLNPIFSCLLLFFLWNCTTTPDSPSDENSLALTSDSNSYTSIGKGENNLSKNSNSLSSEDNNAEYLTLPAKKVHFAFDQSTINPDFKKKLAKIAGYLKRNPEKTLRIDGHCDEKGTVEYNLALGQRRADAVKRFLLILGVDADRLTTHTYGKEKLANTSGTTNGDYENRRAEFEAHDSSQSVF